MFGTNYLVLEIAPSSDGGLTRGTTAEIRFKDQALFGFVRIIEKTREHAIETRQNNQAAADEADGLRMCSFLTDTSSI
jgi:WW domain-binding protein 2